MNFIQKCFIATQLLLLLLQVTITYAFLEKSSHSNGLRIRTTTSGTAQQPSDSISIIDSYENSRIIENRTNIIAKVTTSAPIFFLRNTDEDDGKEHEYEEEFNKESMERRERPKRDIRTDLLENELQIATKVFNSEINSLSKSSVNSIISQANGLNGLRNLLNLNINNLAAKGLNDLSSIAITLPTSVQNCYNSYGFKFSDAINVGKTMALQCLSEKINQAKSIAQDFQYSIANAAANIKDVSEQIGQCQLLANTYPFIAGLVAKAACLNIAIFSLRGETVLLPIKFATLAGQAFNSITTIQSDMNKCSLEIINTILDQSIQSGKAINNCINEQSGVTTSTLSPQ